MDRFESISHQAHSRGYGSEMDTPSQEGSHSSEGTPRVFPDSNLTYGHMISPSDSPVYERDYRFHENENEIPMYPSPGSQFDRETLQTPLAPTLGSLLLWPHEPSTSPRNKTCLPIGSEKKELDALRNLFGYQKGKVPCNRQLGNPLRQSQLKDVLFLALDISPPQPKSFNFFFEIGISVLDSHDLKSFVDDGDRSMEGAMAAVSSYQFTVGPVPGLAVNEDHNDFKFGVASYMETSKLAPSIKDLVRGRDVVVVSSNSHSTVPHLRYFGVELSLRPLCTLSVTNLSRLIHSERQSFQGVMDNVGVPHTHDHSRGNSAHFALRTLINLVIDDADDDTGRNFDFCQRLLVLAHCPEAVAIPYFGRPWLRSMMAFRSNQVRLAKVFGERGLPWTNYTWSALLPDL